MGSILVLIGIIKNMLNMKSYLKRTVTVLFLFSTISSVVQAQGDLSKQQAIDLFIDLGNSEGALKFFPNSLEFETGKLYRLTINNPSPQKHYFSSDQFSRAIYTRKVQINRADGSPMVEVKGAVREIEVYPGSSAEWWFVAVKTGAFRDLKCTIKGHAEAGMVGHVSIH